ncbi:recombinase family protein [Alkalicoccus luteus]|uniref:Recombinase family protein n=1 Tax=Alkalicoccus luteus TaxID=1237094 RepID=A0A969TW97_9BACI|nr:recombinase family protein [Alkalicoccus luteus]NJP38962.1 recombinase family protein [Alkalicoccus luteus]
MKIGYARVSTKDQNLERQIEELQAQGCDKIYSEKKSAKNFERPEYQKMKKMLRFGDVLIVHDLSRFGRNNAEIKQEWKDLTEKEIDIVVLNMPILDTRQYRNLEGVGRLVSDIVLAVLSWQVEQERLNNLKAQREGIEIAKRKGKYKGRKTEYSPDGKQSDKYFTIVQMLKDNVGQPEIAKRMKCSRDTVAKIKKEKGL